MTEHQVQKLTGAADEGLALKILVAPRRLTDDHHPGVGLAIGKDHLSRTLFQIAFLIGFHRGPKPIQIGHSLCCLPGQRNRVHSLHFYRHSRGDRLGFGRSLANQRPIHRSVEDGLVRAHGQLPVQCRFHVPESHGPHARLADREEQSHFIFSTNTQTRRRRIEKDVAPKARLLGSARQAV